MKAASRLSGGCHCGGIVLTFESPAPLEELGIRGCTCSFCRAHSARTTSDPQGRVRIVIEDDAHVNRYRFGLQCADFLICRRCGVYVAAVMTTPRGTYATVNVNATDYGERLPAGSAVSYEGEGEQDRIARREARWTPAEVVVGAGR